jgi:hypothetical protein
METQEIEKIQISSLSNKTWIPISAVINSINEKAKGLGLKISNYKEINLSVNSNENLSYNITDNDSNTLYEVNIFQSYYHKTGDGGNRRKTCELKKKINENKSKIVLERRLDHNWTTYSDDSEDFETGISDYMSLKEYDDIATKVFYELKKQN